MYISNTIQEFKINDFVGNNDVPYPLAFSKKNIYFFEYPNGYLSIDEFPEFKSDKDLQKIIDKGIKLNPFLINFLDPQKKLNKITLNDIPLQIIKDLATKKELADRIENIRGLICYKK